MQQCRACAGIISFIVILGMGGQNRGLAGEWSYRLAGEAGWSRARFSDISSRSSPLLRLDSRLQLLRRSRNFSWFVEGQFRPEIFFTDENPSFTRLTLRAGLLRNYRTFHWQLGTTAEHQRFSFFGRRLGIGLFQSGGEVSWRYRPGMALRLHSDIFHRRLDSDLESRLTAWVLGVSWQRRFSLSTGMQVGLRREQFRIRQHPRTGPHTNSGWRLGPEITLSYQKRVALSAQYRFLWHHSDVTRAPSYEHWTRLLFGKILSRSWSVFFLADYYFRSYNFPEVAPPGLVFAPLNSENRISLKLERELSPRADFFVRMGYFSEGIFDREGTLSGWRATLGLELKN